MTTTNSRVPVPLSVACPLCKAGPMTPCRTRTAGRPRIHKARWDLAKAAKPARVPRKPGEGRALRKARYRCGGCDTVHPTYTAAEKCADTHHGARLAADLEPDA